MMASFMMPREKGEEKVEVTKVEKGDSEENGKEEERRDRLKETGREGGEERKEIGEGREKRKIREKKSCKKGRRKEEKTVDESEWKVSRNGKKGGRSIGKKGKGARERKSASNGETNTEQRR